MNAQLSPNELALIALTNEYCQAIENMADQSIYPFVKSMMQLLSRIYIVATDLHDMDTDYRISGFIEQELNENAYDQVRHSLSVLMGEEDVYLDTFVEDMRYSDTPVSATVSENLADLYQVFYNLVHAVQDLTTEDQKDYINAAIVDFAEYWGQKLTNVMRALHNIYYIHDLI